MSFTFKETSSQAYFVVEKVYRSLLPPVDNDLVEVPGRPGAYHRKTKLGVLEFNFQIRIRQKNVRALNDAKRTIAEWLYSENPEKLVLEKEPDKYYLAKLDGNTDLEEIVKIGKGTLKFICPDPIAFDQYEVLAPIPLGTEAANINVDGTYKTFPVVRATFKKDTTVFLYATENENEQVFLGKPVDVDTETAVPLFTRVLYERFESLPNWQVSTTGVEYGTATGSMRIENVGTGYVTYEDIGTGVNWHGPSRKRSLPEPLDNWKIDFFPRFKTNVAKELGRIELYLLDVNSEIIGKMYIGDRYNASMLVDTKIRIGSDVNGVNILQGSGDKPGVWNDFTGQMQFIKTGSRFQAYIGIINYKTGQHHTRKYEKFVDSKNQFTKKLAQVQIYIAGYGTAPIPVRERMFIDHLDVYKQNIIQKNQVEYIARADDVIEIDHYTKEITKNGMPFKKYLNPVSNLFSLKPGSNAIGFQPSDVADVEVSYRSRWL
ncbi:hypothetical protein F7731_23510 [Cytobacillus depressus]|uniref:Phage tail family protein n=1 Tax=Cytobacillus depressus TaxID=1602942 RepID=A0A6L3UY07_9BACI|nr:distal tail protein Dit [Cytobacillus depressus]KAB2328924.1 hypothetical protein F7731_23510 [Cytobacillus depressus]